LNAIFDGKKFERAPSYNTGEHNFCCHQHYAEWKKDRREVECDWCGKTFEKILSRVGEHNFCSHECHSKFQEKKKEVECENCGKIVEKLPSLIKRAEHHFCSTECHNKWRSGNVRGKSHPLFNKKKISCDYCGKEFLRRPSHINRRNYCSRECKGEDRSKRGRVKVTCAICGEEFETHRSRAEKCNSHFCSQECYKKGVFEEENNPNWRGGYATVECLYCNEEFEVRPARKDEAKFCSMECLGKWRAENVRGENHPLYGKANEKMQGEKNPAWRGGYEPYYGENWHPQRRKALERDNHTCQVCGIEEDGREHDVHHITHRREFDTLEEANALGNLITLCKPCHGKANMGRISEGKLRGLI